MKITNKERGIGELVLFELEKYLKENIFNLTGEEDFAKDAVDNAYKATGFDNFIDGINNKLTECRTEEHHKKRLDDSQIEKISNLANPYFISKYYRDSYDEFRREQKKSLKPERSGSFSSAAGEVTDFLRSRSDSLPKIADVVSSPFKSPRNFPLVTKLSPKLPRKSESSTSSGARQESSFEDDDNIELLVRPVIDEMLQLAETANNDKDNKGDKKKYEDQLKSIAAKIADLLPQEDKKLYAPRVVDLYKKLAGERGMACGVSESKSKFAIVGFGADDRSNYDTRGLKWVYRSCGLEDEYEKYKSELKSPSSSPRETTSSPRTPVSSPREDSKGNIK